MPDPRQKTFEFTRTGQAHLGCLGCLRFGHYRDGNDAVELYMWSDDNGGGEAFWEPFARLSINTDYICEPGQFVVNHDCTDLVRELADAHGLFADTGLRTSYGFVQDQPIFRVEPVARDFEYWLDKEK
jgi:hypothetical protein